MLFPPERSKAFGFIADSQFLSKDSSCTRLSLSLEITISLLEIGTGKNPAFPFQNKSNHIINSYNCFGGTGKESVEAMINKMRFELSVLCGRKLEFLCLDMIKMSKWVNNYCSLTRSLMI